MANPNQGRADLEKTNSLLQAILQNVSGSGQPPGGQAQGGPSVDLEPIILNSVSKGMNTGLNPPGLNPPGAQSGYAPTPQPQPQMPRIPQSIPMPQQQRPQPNLDANGQTPFGRFLSQMGIPLTTAIAGVAGGGNTNFLSGATGFQQGYVGEKQRQKVRKEEQQDKIDLSKIKNQGTYDYVLVDREGNVVKTMKVPTGTHVAQQSSNSNEFLSQLMNQQPEGQIGQSVKNAQQQTENIESGDNQVPDGVPPGIWNESTPEQRQEYLRRRYGG